MRKFQILNFTASCQPPKTKNLRRGAASKSTIGCAQEVTTTKCLAQSIQNTITGEFIKWIARLG